MTSETVLVVDREIQRIACSTPELHQAVALAEGLINCGVRVVSLENNTYNFNDINIHYQYSDGKIRILSPYQIPNNWMAFRTQVIDRIEPLQILINQAKSRTSDLDNYYNTPMFTAILAVELEKCKPNENRYSLAIEEWALMQDVSVEVAYKELKIKYEDISLTYMRNNALYSRFVRKINQTVGKDNLKQVINEFSRKFGILI